MPTCINIQGFKCCSFPYSGEVERALDQASEDLVPHPNRPSTLLGDIESIAFFLIASLTHLYNGGSKRGVVSVVHSR